jgi:hypothetical protein
MVKRKLSSGNLLPHRSKPFDHGITAILLIVFSSFGLVLGGTMTGMSFGYENREGFTSVVCSTILLLKKKKHFFIQFV